MHTVQKGDLSVAMITARLLQSEYVVLKPITELSRYDLVIDRGSGFERVQCKTGRLKNGAVRFNTASSQAHHRKGVGRLSYRGHCDLFAVYCPDNAQCYLIPVDDVPEAEGTLRIEAPKNNQAKGVRMAADYAIV